MKNGARYIVTTRWGTFSLNEGAYQDYLRGNLWITWEPGQKRKEPIREEPAVPPHTSEQELMLRELANQKGVLHTLRFIGVSHAAPPYVDRLANINIDDLTLSVRSSNGLKRAGVHTFGRLFALMQRENGIKSVRNLGEKSVKEITRTFFEECYVRLLPYEQVVYWKNFAISDHGAFAVSVK